MLKPNLPTIDDREDPVTPAGLPAIVDAHVHVFPQPVFSAVRRWFDENAWHIRYRLRTAEVFDFLLSRGVGHVVALQYAHKPGIAGDLNRYLAEQCRMHPGRVTGMATVFPGEKGASAILEEAFRLGLGGLKLHAHVQCFDMNAPETRRLYAVCRSHDKPVVMHVGREPKSEAYLCDPYALCSADKLKRVLLDFPDLKICVPHLGFDETGAYRRLIERHDNLWLDTTMSLTGYFPSERPVDLRRYRLNRVMYGSDFPNIPYAWDRELKWIENAGLSPDDLEWVCHKTAATFFGIPPIAV